MILKLNQARVVKQVIILKHNHNSLRNIILLINYVLTNANKWLLISESRDDSNRCTPCKGNLTNTPHASHTQSAYGLRPYVSHTVNT
jgi:hypothetical protein